MPKYKVRLSIIEKDGEKSGCCWHTEVPVEPYQRLSVEEIERRALMNARQAFGDQASTWKYLDSVRKR